MSNGEDSIPGITAETHQQHDLSNALSYGCAIGPFTNFIFLTDYIFSNYMTIYPVSLPRSRKLKKEKKSFSSIFESRGGCSIIINCCKILACPVSVIGFRLRKIPSVIFLDYLEIFILVLMLLYFFPMSSEVFK